MAGKTNPSPMTIEEKIQIRKDRITYLEGENLRLGREASTFMDERDALEIKRDNERNVNKRIEYSNQMQEKLDSANKKEGKIKNNKDTITRLESEITDLEQKKVDQDLDGGEEEYRKPNNAPFNKLNEGKMVNQDRRQSAGGRLPGAQYSEKLFELSRFPEYAKSVNAEQPVSPQTTATESPPLVRLDGQKLRTPEMLYPEMSYRENVHQAWPAEAIEVATKKYPDLPKWVEESRQLVPDSPADLQDPDYYALPDNPTFLDQFYHGRWQDKKQGPKRQQTG
jgi:hypothetical protein